MSDHSLMSLGEALDALSRLPHLVLDLPDADTERIYRAARAVSGGKPILYAMTLSLIDTIKGKPTVILATGEYDREGFTHGETDGPYGVASLAHAFHKLGCRVVLCHDPILQPVHHTIIDRFVGVDFEVADFPGGPGFDHRAHSAAILDRHKPTVLIAVEKLGRNSVGVYHGASGYPATDADMNRVDVLFDVAHERGLLTLGFGDHGNEIGFGAIQSEAKAANPVGSKCTCPCGRGIIAITPTTHLLPCTVSNWGAIALSDMLGVATQREDLLHTAENEDRLLDLGVEAGAVEALSMKPIRGVDGFTGEYDLAIIRLMYEASLMTLRRG